MIIQIDSCTNRMSLMKDLLAVPHKIGNLLCCMHWQEDIKVYVIYMKISSLEGIF